MITETEHGAETVPLVAVISAAAEDRAALAGILDGGEWDVLCLAALKDAAGMAGHASVVICDAELPDGGWRQLLAGLEGRSNPASLIVSATGAGNQLWAEVLSEGGYDVLAKPFRSTEVLQAVVSACRLRKVRGEGRQPKAMGSSA